MLPFSGVLLLDHDPCALLPVQVNKVFCLWACTYCAELHNLWLLEVALTSQGPAYKIFVWAWREHYPLPGSWLPVTSLTADETSIHLIKALNYTICIPFSVIQQPLCKGIQCWWCIRKQCCCPGHSQKSQSLPVCV